MSRPLLLDLYSCAGGAAKGYHDAGFDVVGIDIDDQPHYPYTFHRADALEFFRDNWRQFDAVHASPPCQGHSTARHAWGREYETTELLDLTLVAVRESGLPYIVENVGGASMPSAGTLCGTSFGLGLHRHRRFETSFAWLAPPCDPSRVRYRGRAAEVFGHHGNTDRVRREWGVPWMTQYEIAQSIPPAFTEHLGAYLLDEVKAAA